MSRSGPILALLTCLAACSSTTRPLPIGPRDGGPDGGVVANEDARPIVSDDAEARPDDAQPALPDAGVLDAGSPADSGLAISAQPLTWTWVDFPESRCDDGTTTGIGVNRSSTSDNVLVFLNGGGSCWDYNTCYQLNTAAHGPFGRNQFNQLAPVLVGGIYDRSSAANPFRDWTYVFVPYCTGDLHAGTNVVTYQGPGGVSRVHHHTGYANLQAYLRRLGATFPNPPKMVLSGASAGGYGVLFTYPEVRRTWPNARSYAIDDSGPVLPAAYTIPAVRDAWVSAWNIDDVLVPLCGPGCVNDFAQVHAALSSRYPNDRFALTSSMQDATIRAYFQLTPAAFQAAIVSLVRDAILPLPNFEAFLVNGDSHTMLASPQLFFAQGVSLFDWMRAQVEDNPAWTSIGP